MAFPRKQQFVFKHFTSDFTGVANAIYAQMIHMINCSEVFTSEVLIKHYTPTAWLYQ